MYTVIEVKIMLDYTNIQKYRENNRIEAKRALGGLPHSIWESYSAFANTLGGVILLGVEEFKDKSLHPVDLPEPEKLIEEFWNLLNDKKKVSANILSKRNISVQEIDGKNIVIIEVPRAGRFNRPVYIDGNPYGGSYRRNGEGDYRCSQYEVESMLRDAAVITPDSCVIEGMSLDCFDYDIIKSYREEVGRYRPNYVPKDMDRYGFLERIGAAHGGNPTFSGLLMFGKYDFIKSRFPNFSLIYHSYDTSFATADVDFPAITDNRPIVNVYDFYRRIKNALEVKNAKYPISVKYALLEALSNSITNADYFGGCGISMFYGESAVVISNPGGFRINVKDAKSGGVSDPRNSSIIKMLTLIGGGEKMGSGIPEIFSVWRKEGWSEPIISERYHPLRTTLYLPLTKNVGKTGEIHFTSCPENQNERDIKSAYRKSLIIEHLTYSVTADESELCKILYVTKDDLSVLINQLIADGLVVMCKSADNQPTYRLKA